MITDLLTEAAAMEELERAKIFQQRWKLYEGDHDKPMATYPGKEGRPSVDDNVIINFLGGMVDRGVSFLVGQEQTVEFGLDESGTENPDETYLDEIWGANKKKTLLRKVATNGGVCGHMFIKIVPNAIDDTVRLINLDPGNVNVLWHPDDFETILAYKIQFNTIWEGRAAVRRQLIEKDESGNFWTITDEISRGDSDAFEAVNEPVRWDFPFSPIVDSQNLPKPNEFWGRSDLEGGPADLNTALNKSASSMQRIIRIFGHPTRWTAGVTPEQIAILIQGPDRVVTLPEGAALNQTEMSGDLASSLEFYMKLKEAFNETSRNPTVDPEKLGSVGGMSGVALRILYQPLLEKTETKRGLFGDMLVQANRRLLAIGGKEEQDTVLTWPNVLPQNEKEDAEVAVIDKELGVSVETTLEKRGYDPEQETQRRENDPAPTLGQTADTLLNNPAFNAGGVG